MSVITKCMHAIIVHDLWTYTSNEIEVCGNNEVLLKTEGVAQSSDQ